MERTAALVIRLVPWSEASYVVELFTRRLGKVEAVAKGARRAKNPFDTAMELLAVSDAVLLRKRGEALDIVAEAKLEFRFRPPQAALANLYAGYYVAEMLHALTEPEDAQPSLFDAAVAVLELWRRREVNPWMIFRWETAALKLLGVQPSLAHCAECGRVASPRGRIAFAPIHGGVVCPECRQGKRPVLSLSAPTWKAWMALAQEPLAAVTRTQPLPIGSSGELRAVMNQYLAHLRGAPWRMHPLLPG